MYQHLEEVLGSETATSLMEHLPPVGWADVATKRDLDALEVATRHDIESLELRLRADIANMFRNHTYAVLGGFAVLNTILLVASKL